MKAIIANQLDYYGKENLGEDVASKAVFVHNVAGKNIGFPQISVNGLRKNGLSSYFEDA